MGPADHLRFAVAPDGGAAILLLHGHGGDAGGMAGVAVRLAAAFPGISVVSLAAPEHAPGGGRRWFSVDGVDEAGRGARLMAALPGIVRVVADEVAVLCADARRVVLVGFSQGATTALQLATASGVAPLAVVSMSGRLANPIPAQSRIATAFLLSHGDADRIIAVHHLDDAVRALTEAGCSVQTLRRPGLGHAIDDAQIDAAIDFIASTLRRAVPIATAGI